MLKKNSVIIRSMFGLNDGLGFCSPYPPASSEWKRKGATEFRRRGVIKQMIFKNK